MRIALGTVLIVSLFVLYSCNDSTLNTVDETRCPLKIASMSLVSDEVLLEIIDDDRVVGVTYLAENENLSNVYSEAGAIPNKLRPNLEQIIDLEPDLVVVADYIDFGFLNQVRKSGIEVLLLKNFNSLNNIKKNISVLGDAVCEKERTDKLISDMDLKFREIRDRKIENNPTVLYLFPSLFTSGAETTIGEIIELAGGINIGKRAGIRGNKKISMEYIVETDPDIIIIGSYSPADDNFKEKLKSDKVLKNLTAVRNDHVYQVETKHLTTVSHHIAKGMEDLSDIIIGYNEQLNADKKKTPN